MAGSSCAAVAYSTANMLPTALFEIIAGGALAVAVVPILSVASGEQRVRIINAMITWAVLWLSAVTVVLILLAAPLMNLLIDVPAGCSGVMDTAGLGARMLVAFAPQVVLYGIAGVLYGVLQVEGRFAVPAAAPLVSSIVVIASYLWFGAVTPDPDRMNEPSEIVLSWGTTLGVAALAATALQGLRGLGVRIRPVLSFPPKIARKLLRLGLAGLAAIVAQQLSIVVASYLANTHGGPGALLVYSFSYAVYQVPYAVMLAPIATTVFPKLVSEHVAGNRDVVRRLAMQSLRLSLIGGALCVPVVYIASSDISRIFLVGVPGNASSGDMAVSLSILGLSLPAYGVANLGARILQATGRSRLAAGCIMLTWMCVLVAQGLVSLSVASDHVPHALAAGMTLGMTVGSAITALAACRQLPGRRQP
ncbi:lipid II flippase MurJ [Nonomuraea bangladeshensis]|uniref:Lipid II flippase MurJ n=1 Tax=Nonomuraea bangladeshensis TaxID=404385 RepID=A0ABV3H8L8_9ACTN